VNAVQERAVGEEVMNGLNPAQMVIKIVNEEMTTLMGSETTELALQPGKQMTVVMMVGLQGAGKTTTAAKIAGKFKQKGKKPLLVALDIYRPAAIKQLQVNGEKQGVEVFTMGDRHDPADIAKAAIEHAAKNKENLVILDTAGRLQIDESMMQELENIKKAVTVHQTILVVDAMTGQEAVNVAKTFDEKVGVDGVILSKMDGDTRGGAALSIKAVTGKPILYVGMGEKLSDLEQFYPDRMAGRILGMGDVLTLIDKAQQALDKQDEQDSKDMVSHLKKGKFDFNDYLNSLKQMRKMGGLSSILGMMPGMGISKDQLENVIDEKQLKRTEAIVLSMTPEERMNPKLLTPQRKYRIAKGSGNDIADVNRFIKSFNQMSKVMKQAGGKKGKRRRNANPFGGMGGMGGFGGMGGRRGGGFPF
jgi:signal recognition particle subunit SRP54